MRILKVTRDALFLVGKRWKLSLTSHPKKYKSETLQWHLLESYKEKKKSRIPHLLKIYFKLEGEVKTFQTNRSSENLQPVSFLYGIL